MKEEFDREVERWITDGILVEVDGDRQVESVVPLIAVAQVTKNKVRPVLDFRELNQFVSCHSGDSAVCDDTIWK